MFCCFRSKIDWTCTLPSHIITFAYHMSNLIIYDVGGWIFALWTCSGSNSIIKNKTTTIIILAIIMLVIQPKKKLAFGYLLLHKNWSEYISSGMTCHHHHHQQWNSFGHNNQIEIQKKILGYNNHHVNLFSVFIFNFHLFLIFLHSMIIIWLCMIIYGT